MSVMPALTLNLLGPLTATLDDQPVDFRTTKVQALLVYLALERARPHRREALMDLLWPDMPLESAQVNLRQTIYRLRQAIPEVSRKGGGKPVPLLDADRQTVQLHPAADVRLDVDAFQTALDTDPARAAHLYRGNFLSDFFLVDSTVFEVWAETLREKLRRQILRVLDELTQTHLDQGNTDDAQTFAWKQLEIDPLREPAYRQLMLALANSGQRNAAVCQYEMYQHRLNDELGLEPAEETRLLYEQIQADAQRPAPPTPKKKKTKTMPVFMLTDIEGSTQLWDTYHHFPPLRIPAHQAPEPTPARAHAAPTRPRHNLTSQPTPFVGRQRELTTLDAMLSDPDVRLITLVGPGGMGKTRLALALAARQVERRTAETGYLFPDGVFFISLVAINSPDQIIPLIAKMLNVPIEISQSTEPMERATQTATTPKEKLLGYLANRRMLLVLDNFEHVIEGAEVVSELLAASPLQVVVTSRERLHIREEQIYPITGLDFPEWEAPETPEEYTAMELFLQSARRVQPDFVLENGDMVALTRVCRLVGGMPLGLELAASWVNMLSLQEIAAEIQKCFDFLETDLRNLPDRHRSIRAVFNSSWNQLNEAEKQLFARLSIFRGTFDREAAEKIARARLQTLANLAGKSLLQYDAEGKRYQVHELLRQYGAEQLAAHPEEEYDTLHCFSTFYCREAERHIQLFTSGQTQMAMERFELDATNIRLAWDWAVSQGKVALINEAANGLCAYFDWTWRAEDGLAVCGAGDAGHASHARRTRADPAFASKTALLARIFQPLLPARPGRPGLGRSQCHRRGTDRQWRGCPRGKSPDFFLSGLVELHRRQPKTFEGVAEGGPGPQPGNRFAMDGVSGDDFVGRCGADCRFTERGEVLVWAMSDRSQSARQPVGGDQRTQRFGMGGPQFDRLSGSGSLFRRKHRTGKNPPTALGTGARAGVFRVSGALFGVL
jgi:DNA-binding SARP family transcriptional activator/predicted ATPase